MYLILFTVDKKFNYLYLNQHNYIYQKKVLQKKGYFIFFM